MRVATPRVWAIPLSLATTRGIVFTFFSCGYLDVSVPRVRLRLSRMMRSPAPGCPIRISADHWAFAPPRGFSQLITSFFASESQGIPHAPFLHSVIPNKSRNLAWYLFSPSTSCVENTGPFCPLLISSLKSSLLFLFAIYVILRNPSCDRPLQTSLPVLSMSSSWVEKQGLIPFFSSVSP